jgi:hypothetical protein
MEMNSSDNEIGSSVSGSIKNKDYYFITTNESKEYKECKVQ